jgi:hypothetical protein
MISEEATQFYLTLAQRDIGMMAEALQKLVTPEMIQARDNDDSGYAADLISTAAVIYAKIAWHHGYEARVDSPYIPAVAADRAAGAVRRPLWFLEVVTVAQGASALR